MNMGEKTDHILIKINLKLTICIGSQMQSSPSFSNTMFSLGFPICFEIWKIIHFGNENVEKSPSKLHWDLLTLLANIFLNCLMENKNTAQKDICTFLKTFLKLFNLLFPAVFPCCSEQIKLHMTSDQKLQQKKLMCINVHLFS